MTEKKNETPFIKAVGGQTRLKVLVFGDMGTWKTRMGLHLPSPTVIDMEHGTDIYANEFDFYVKHTIDPDECMGAVNWLLNNKHDYRTFIHDSITIYWAALQDKFSSIFAHRNRGKAGDKIEYYDIQPSDWKVIKAEFKRYLRKILKLDMNVWVTAHQKKLYADGDFMKVIGDTFDGEKGLGYMFDIVLQSFTKGGEPYAKALKDRTFKLPKGDFEFKYEVIAKCFGEDSLNRKAEYIPLATSTQIHELKNWYVNALFLIDEPKRFKLLSRYEVETEEDLTQTQAKEILDKFEESFNKLKAKEKPSENKLG